MAGLSQAPTRRFPWVLLIAVAILALLAAVSATAALVATLPTRIDDQQTLVFGQPELSPGSTAGLRVLVRQASSAQPLAGAEIRVALRPKAGDTATELFTGRTDPAGTADVHFQVPTYAAGEGVLTVEARSKLGRDTVTSDVKAVRQVKILLTSDKPVYQPGQVIHMRGLVLSAADRKPAAQTPLDFVVEDAKGNKVFRQQATTSDYGIASTDFRLAEEVNQGTYKLIAEVAGTQAEKTVTVKWYVLPKFRVDLTTERPWYLPGETLRGRARADYFFGKPVAGGEMVVTASVYTAGEQTVAQVAATLDEEGGGDFTLDVPTYLVAGAPEQGAASLVLAAEVTDQAGHVERISREIAVAEQPIVLDAVPESAELAAGVENIIYLMASYPDGSPAAVHGEADYGSRHLTFETGALGVADLRVVPEARIARSLLVQVQDAAGRTAVRTFSLEQGWNETQVLLRPDRPFYRVGDTMHLDAFVIGPSRTIYLDIVREGQTISTRAEPVTGGRATFDLDLSGDLVGTLGLHAYTVLPDGTIVRDTRLAVVDAPQEVSVSLQADKESYRPGETARLVFQITREGTAEAGALGLAIVDESVFSVEEQDPGFARLYFLLEAELLKPKYQIKDTLAPEILTPLEVAPAVAAQRSSITQAALAPVTLAGPGLRVDSRPAKLATLRVRQREAWDDLSLAILVALAVLAAGLIAAALWGLARRGLLRWRLLAILTLILFGTALASLALAFIALIEAWPALILLVVLAALAWLAGLIALAVRGVRGRDAASQLIALLVVGHALLLVPAVIVIDQAQAPPEGALIAALITYLAGMVTVFLFGVSLWRAGDREAGRPAVALGAGMPVLALTAALASASFGAGGARLAMPAAAPTAAPAAVQMVVTQVVEKVVEKPVEAPAAPGAQPPRLRQYFPETLYWNPEAISDEAGRIALDVPLADSITTWRLSAQASTAGGALGGLTAGLRVFQDFFVDLDLPVALTQNDEIAVPVSIYNYLAEAQTVRLELAQESWFEMLGPPTVEVDIGPNDVTGASFRIRAREFGRQRLMVTAWGSHMSDAIAREVRVLPDGKEIRRTHSDWLVEGTRGVVRIAEQAIPGTAQVIVKVYPGPLSQMVEGLDSLLRLPYG